MAANDPADGADNAQQTQQSEAPTGQPNQDAQAYPAGSDDSIVDLAQQPIVKLWTKFVAALFAFAGIGAGLSIVLRDIVEQPVVDGAAYHWFPIVDVPSLAAIAAVFLGVYLGWQLQTDDTTAYLTAGIPAFVGTVVAMIIAAVLFTVPMDGTSLEFGGLIFSSIVSGIGVAVAAVGGVWTSRNLAPAQKTETTSVAPESAVQTSD